MAFIQIDWPSPNDERPWSFNQGPNDSRRLGHWHQFQLESIQQRYDLGIPLSVEELAMLNESRRTHPKPVQAESVSTIVEPEPKPNKRRWKGRIAGRDTKGRFTTDNPAWTYQEELKLKKGEL